PRDAPGQRAIACPVLIENVISLRMRRPSKASRAVAAVLVITALAAAGCARRERSGTPVIVASIFPVQDLVQRIVGDDAEVRTLMPPGANPHGFEVTASGTRELADAKVLVVVGRHLDDWATKAASRSGRNDLEI